MELWHDALPPSAWLEMDVGMDADGLPVLWVTAYAPEPSGPEPEPGPNVITNGGFEDGVTSWIFYTNGSGTFQTTAPGYEGTRCGLVTIADAGTNTQLYQPGIALEPYVSYRLSFALRGSPDSSVLARLIQHVSPYTGYGFGQSVALTGEWVHHEYTFTTTGFEEPVTNGRLAFLNPGSQTVEVDAVELRRVL
jgi:hypothetical protein